MPGCEGVPGALPGVRDGAGLGVHCEVEALVMVGGMPGTGAVLGGVRGAAATPRAGAGRAPHGAGYAVCGRCRFVHAGDSSAVFVAGRLPMAMVPLADLGSVLGRVSVRTRPAHLLASRKGVGNGDT